MMDPARDVRAPACVRVNQPDVSSVLAAYQDPALLAKKGRLYVLCTRETPLPLLSALYERYYTDPSFDIVPVLKRILTALAAEDPQARATLPLAVVLEGLNMAAVGTPAGSLWLDRFAGARELLPAGREARTLFAPDARDPWLAAQYRLSAGDTLVLSTQAAMHKLSERGWKGLSARGDLKHAAHSLAGRAGHGAPVTLISMTGFAPVADLGPLRRVPGAKTTTRTAPAPREHSPIWPTLFLAALVVGVIFAIKRPVLSRDSLIHLFDWALTPIPTNVPTPKGTPPSRTRTVVVLPTATPAPVTPTESAEPADVETAALTPSPTATKYPAPELLFPREREELVERSVTLRWAWSGALAQDEWFDVRMWREGMPKTSIAWTKERSYLERYLRPGWYHWTVTVVRGQGRTVVSELSNEPAPVNYLVLGEGETPKTPTPTPAGSTPSPEPSATSAMPTRVTPVNLPTRVTPVVQR